MNSPKALLPLLAFLLCLFGAAHEAMAATRTWTNGGGTGNWNLATNWSTNKPNGTTDLLLFDSTQASVYTSNNDFATPSPFVVGAGGNAITFQGSAVPWVLQGSSININGSVVVGTGIAAVIQNNIVSGTGTNVGVSGGGTLFLSGTNTQTGNLNLGGGGVVVLNSANALGSWNLILSTAGAGIVGLGTNGPTALTLGTGAGLVSIANGNGFAAYGSGTHSLSLNSGAALNMGGSQTAGFVSSSLTMGSSTATATIDLQNNIVINSGIKTFTANDGSAAVDVILSGAISGGSAITKSGSGTLAFSGSNSYTGSTTVSAGTLLISSTGSIAASSAVTVQSSAAIGGDGTINGNLTLNSGAKFVFDLNNTPLTLVGTFALSNTFGVGDLVTSSLAAIDWSTVNTGTYKLMGTSFVFDATNISNYGVGNALSTGGKQVYFTSGSNLLNVVVAVPEPATWALFGLAIFGLGARRFFKGVRAG